MPRGKPGTGTPHTRKTHHKQKSTPANSTQTAATQTASANPTPAATANAATTRASNSRLPAPRSIPDSILREEADRLRGLIVERQRLLDLAESAYQQQIGRLVEHYKLDANFAWEFSGGFMIPSERIVSSGMAMASSNS